MRKYELIDSLRGDLKRFKYKPDIKIIAYYTLPYWDETGNPFMEFYDYFILEYPSKEYFDPSSVTEGFTLDEEYEGLIAGIPFDLAEMENHLHIETTLKRLLDEVSYDSPHLI